MYLLHRLIIFAVELLSESVVGQTEKNSVRAYVFRLALELGHCLMQSACLKRANAQSRCAPARCAGARAERPVAD